MELTSTFLWLHQSFPTLDTVSEFVPQKERLVTLLHRMFATFTCLWYFKGEKDILEKQQTPVEHCISANQHWSRQALILPIQSPINISQPWGRELASLMKPGLCQVIWSTQYCITVCRSTANYANKLLCFSRYLTLNGIAVAPYTYGCIKSEKQNQRQQVK